MNDVTKSRTWQTKGQGKNEAGLKKLCDKSKGETI